MVNLLYYLSISNILYSVSSYKSFRSFATYFRIQHETCPNKDGNQPLEHACVTLLFWPAKNTRKITESGFTCEPRKTLPIPYPIQWNSSWLIVGSSSERNFILLKIECGFKDPQENSLLRCLATKLTILNSDHGTYVPFKTLEVEKQHGVAEAM